MRLLYKRKGIECISRIDELRIDGNKIIIRRPEGLSDMIFTEKIHQLDILYVVRNNGVLDFREREYIEVYDIDEDPEEIGDK